MRDYQTYIFDLDGTLINSIDDLATSCNFALRQFGLKEYAVDEVRMMVGNGVKKLMERATPNGLAIHCSESTTWIIVSILHVRILALWKPCLC